MAQQFDETVELVLPVAPGEEAHCALWLLSLQVTCPQNSVYATIIDPANCLLSSVYAPSFVSNRIQIVDCGGQKLSRNKQIFMGVKMAREARPSSRFVMLSHADVVGVTPGWLDTALDVLLDDAVGCVGFQPSGMVRSAAGDITYADDWLMITKTSALDAVGECPDNIASFGLSVWYHAALASVGMRETILYGGDNIHLVSHARKRSYLGIGRKSDPALTAAELEAIRQYMIGPKK